jgi:MraZ protein
LFRGRFEFSIDSKGRISIPSKFREILSEKYENRLVITNFDRGLLAFPYNEWLLLEEKTGTLNLLKRETSAFYRFFYSSATDCSIDKQGRLLIPPSLREYANLQKDVVLLGEGKCIEIFSKERWLEEAGKVETDFDQLRDTLANLVTI